MLKLAQRVSTMIEESYKKQSPLNEDDNLDDDDDNKSMLSILNMTGCDVYIDNISGIEVDLLILLFNDSLLIAFHFKVCRE